jgi:hypothetical protein
MKYVLVLAALVIPLLWAPSRVLCRGERQGCYRACASCRTHCRGDQACLRTCYELKAACCRSNGYGLGPHKDCTCT